jgi:hypothetical protein
MEARDYGMERREYCDNVSFELTGWKTKIDDVVRKLDHFSTGEKERVVNEVNELHIISDELNDRLQELCLSCTTTWEPKIEDHEVTWPEQSAKTWDFISLSDVGG